MADAGIAIRAEHLTKRYRIGKLDSSRQLRDVLAGAFSAPVHRLRDAVQRRSWRRRRDPQAEVWAVRDVSFDVRQGEIIGLIGRNGAGKTTLLKILSRITEPTSGEAIVVGRVASLLEVGTGFHPELTGRENVYLNGAILGMRKAELDRKLEEIVAFAAVERFIDTPIKRYSAGMHVRLAFSVAAHVEADILLVDEVLAVGDAEFQKKCLGKLRNVTHAGKTVLFVSHNMAAIRNLCQRVLLVDQGQLLLDGTAAVAIARHLGHDEGGHAAHLSVEALERRTTAKGWDGRGNIAIRCTAVGLLAPDGSPRTQFTSDEEITLYVEYECLMSGSDFRVIVSVEDSDHAPILTTQNADDPDNAPFYQLTPGLYRSTCVFPRNLFGEKRFYVSIQLGFPHVDWVDMRSVLSFDVEFLGYNNIQYLAHKSACLRPRLNWHTSVRKDVVVSEREKVADRSGSTPRHG